MPTLNISPLEKQKQKYCTFIWVQQLLATALLYIFYVKVSNDNVKYHIKNLVNNFHAMCSQKLSSKKVDTSMQ